MSVQTAIQNAQAKVADAYTAAAAKGATMPATQNLSNLATTIGTITTGGSTPSTYIPRANVNGVFKNPNTITSFSVDGATDIDAYALSYAFSGCTSLTSVDLSSLTTISGQRALMYAFNICTGLTSVDLSSLTTVGSYALDHAFYYCTGLTSVDLSSLTTVAAYALDYAFANCTGLTSIDLSSLTTVGSYALYYAFYYCTGLTSLSFPALTSSSFGSYTNQFNTMLRGVTGCTVHFPSNLQSVIGSWSDVTAGFGGTDTVVLFDLPATE